MTALPRLLTLISFSLTAAGSAAETYFYAEHGPANPFQALSFDGYTHPAFADVDADGDTDLLVMESGILLLARNTGSATAPLFPAPDATAFSSLALTSGSRPSIGNMDGDSDLDLVVGNPAGTLRYFRNTGTPAAMVLTELTAAANPFNGLPCLPRPPSPGDGLLRWTFTDQPPAEPNPRRFIRAKFTLEP